MSTLEQNIPITLPPSEGCGIFSGKESDNGEVADTTQNTQRTSVEESEAEDGPVIDIIINNVVCSFATRCHLNLRKIATEGLNVEYKREHGMVNMKLRKPRATASIWSSGKITCTGSTSEEFSRTAARRIARILQKMGFRVKFSDFHVVNVLGTCSLPFTIRIINFSREHRQNASYEPELHPGVTYRLTSPKATLKIFSTGSITVTAPCVANVQAAIEHIFPLVSEFKGENKVDGKCVKSGAVVYKKDKMPVKSNSGVTCVDYVDSDCMDEEDSEQDTSEDCFDSEESQD